MWTKERMHALLDKSDKAVMRALLALYARQTQDEKAMGYTSHANGAGFNKRDAEWLSDIARKVPIYGRLTPRQTAAVRPRMKFYWRQLVDIANANGMPVPQEVDDNVIDVEASVVPDPVASIPLARATGLVETGDYV